MEVLFAEVGGMAVMEGDIILDEDAARARAQYRAWKEGYRAAVLTTNNWNDGIVAVEFAKALPDWKVDLVREAMATLEEQTILRFREVDPFRVETNWVLVESGDWNLSHIGRADEPGSQLLTLNDSASLGVATHELLHAAGFRHEQTRRDRDQHVIINWDNLVKGQRHNYEMWVPGVHASTADVGSYSTDSVMHYASFISAHAINPAHPVLLRRVRSDLGKEMCAGAWEAPPSECVIARTSAPSVSDVLGAARVVAAGETPVRVRSDVSGLCLQPEDETRLNSLVVQATCSSADEQRWSMHQRWHETWFINAKSQMCLTINKHGDLSQRPCSAVEDDQPFEVAEVNDSRVQIRAGSECVRAATKGDLSVYMSSCSGASARQWTLELD